MIIALIFTFFIVGFLAYVASNERARLDHARFEAEADRFLSGMGRRPAQLAEMERGERTMIDPLPDPPKTCYPAPCFR